MRSSIRTNSTYFSRICKRKHVHRLFLRSSTELRHSLSFNVHMFAFSCHLETVLKRSSGSFFILISDWLIFIWYRGLVPWTVHTKRLAPDTSRRDLSHEFKTLWFRGTSHIEQILVPATWFFGKIGHLTERDVVSGTGRKDYSPRVPTLWK